MHICPPVDKYRGLVKKYLLEGSKIFFMKVDPSHFLFKSFVDQQFTRKNLLQCESFFISLNFFAGETFENWGKKEVQLHRTSYLMSPSLYM